MVALNRLALAGFLMPLASAAPDQLEGRSYCQRDSCFKAAGINSVNPPCAARTADCVSFLRQTVRPCDVTTTKTETKLATTRLPKVTVTTTKTSTAISTDIQTVYDVHTAANVVSTDVESTTVEKGVIAHTTVFPTITKFQVDTTTSTVAGPTTTITATLRKRVIINPVAERDENGDLEQRGNYGKCVPVTSSPTKMPLYASVCRDAARYSSACSCNGNKAATTTLKARTATSTVVKSATTTLPAATATITKTKTTTTVGATQTTTVATTKHVDVVVTSWVTATISSTTTETVTGPATTVTQESVVTVPVTRPFFLSNAEGADFVLYGDGYLIDTQPGATAFQLVGWDGELWTADGSVFVISDSHLKKLSPEDSANAPRTDKVYCQLGDASSGFASSFTCAGYGGGLNTFGICDTVLAILPAGSTGQPARRDELFCSSQNEVLTANFDIHMEN